MAQNRTIAVGRLAPSPLVCARVRLSHLILLLLPRTQTSLSLDENVRAKEGGKETTRATSGISCFQDGDKSNGGRIWNC